MVEHRGRKPKIENVGEKVNALVRQGFSYQAVADALGLKSRALARYHFLRYRELTKKSKRI